MAQTRWQAGVSNAAVSNTFSLAYEHLVSGQETWDLLGAPHRSGDRDKLLSLPYEHLGPELGPLGVVVRSRSRFGAFLYQRARYGIDDDLYPRYGVDLNLEPDE